MTLSALCWLVADALSAYFRIEVMDKAPGHQVRAQCRPILPSGSRGRFPAVVATCRSILYLSVTILPVRDAPLRPRRLDDPLLEN
jgi:hypothetical protein